MTEDINPAMTPEQWAAITRGEWAILPEVVLTTASEGQIAIAHPIDDDIVQVGECRLALAALCLYGQPFGFTWGDVDALVSLADDAADKPWHDAHYHASALASIAQRITALLPPRQS